MAEIPLKPIEAGPIPENREEQSLRLKHEAEEFLDSHRDTTRAWSTEAEKDAMADKVAATVLAEQPVIPAESTEANVDPKVREMYLELEKDPKGTLDKWISGVKPAANETPGEALNNMTEALREHFKDISQN